MFDVMDAMTGNTYGSSYGATDYSAPAASSYGAPSTGYDAHGHSQYKARTFYDGDDDVSMKMLLKYSDHSIANLV